MEDTSTDVAFRGLCCFKILIQKSKCYEEEVGQESFIRHSLSLYKPCGTQRTLLGVGRNSKSSEINRYTLNAYSCLNIVSR